MVVVLQQSRAAQCLIALLPCSAILVGWVVIPHPAVGLAIGLVPLLILFVLRYPYLMVLLFVLFSFFRIHEVFPQLYSLRIPLLLSLASLGALVWHVGVTRQVVAYWSPELTRVGLFLMLVVVGIVMATNRPLALGYFTSTYWKMILMVFAIAWLARTLKDFVLSLRLVTLSGLAVGLVALYNQANGIGIVEGSRVTIGRDLGSVLGDPNDLSLVLLFPFSFALSLMLSRETPHLERLLGLVTVVVLVLAVIATQSRGGLLGIAAVVAMFAWRRVQSKALLIGGGGLLMVMLYFVAGISGRKSGGAAEAGLDESAMGRLHAWEAAFGMAVDNPLTGVGMNNFYSNYFFYSEYWDGLNHAVHSTWFGVLGETGFIGLLVFLSMVFGLLKCARSSLKQLLATPQRSHPVMITIAEGTLAGLVGFCVSGTFLTQGFTWPLYILLAFTVAIAHFVWQQESEYDPAR
jgi:probable O-glycosylation ligase (exosortase A-associated)